MVVITVKKFTPYNEIDNTTNSIVYYPELLDNKTVMNILLDSPKVISCLSMGLARLVGKTFHKNKNINGVLAYVFLYDEKIEVKNIKTQKIEELDAKRGSVAIFGSKLRDESIIGISDKGIAFYEKNILTYIFLSTKLRIQYAEMIKEKLKYISDLPAWKQCVQKYLPEGKAIGYGCFGNVFSTTIDSYTFAVKISKLKIDEKKCISETSYFELHFLNSIIRPLIAKNMCPNLPLLYTFFTCSNCNLFFNNKYVDTPCITTVIELANGDLKKFLLGKPRAEDIYIALFQIMAGLHCIQLSQIMNFDVKNANVLYYDVEPEGYWHYIVHGEDFYVPNRGKLFVLNDFGISRSMCRTFPMYKTKDETTFRLGSRYAIVKAGEFHPFNTEYEVNNELAKVKAKKIEWIDTGETSFGAEYRMERKSKTIIGLPTEITHADKKYLRDKKVLNLFDTPEIIPPFEFYNDTQDAIRMFTGGKRTTQKGNHRKYLSVPANMVNKLNKYKGKGQSLKNNIFSNDAAQVLAGYFIVKFFRHTFRTPQKPIISTYRIS